MKLSPIAKTVVAALGALASALALYVADGELTLQEGVAIAVAVLTAAGVYGVKNADPAE